MHSGLLSPKVPLLQSCSCQYLRIVVSGQRLGLQFNSNRIILGNVGHVGDNIAQHCQRISQLPFFFVTTSVATIFTALRFPPNLKGFFKKL